MGFLDNTSITVDAILTKKGRELLARGQNEFRISKFALADDEIDYNLYDTTHPNGSNFYGAVIENMPLLEAFVDENQLLRYKLTTLPKETAKLPILEMPNQSMTFNGPGITQAITPNTRNGVDSAYTFILQDASIANITPVIARSGGGDQTSPSIPTTTTTQLPDEASKAFRAIPEEIVEDTLDYLVYVMCTKSSSHSLIENEILTEVVDFLVLFSGASEHIKNPYLRCKFSNSIKASLYAPK